MMALIRVFALVTATLFVLCAPARAFEIQEFNSAKGIKIWLVESHTIPMLSINFTLPRGAAFEARGKEGAAAIMASMLVDGGAGGLDGDAFKAATLKIATDISYSASTDFFSGYMTTLTENRARAIELFKQSLLQPRFGDKELTTVRAQTLQGLLQAKVNQWSIADRAWFGKAYPSHVYGRTFNGSEASVLGIVQQDLAALHKQIMGTAGLRVVAVGDIDAKTLGPLVDNIFGGLPAGDAPDPVPDVNIAKGPVEQTIDFDNPQTVVYFGYPGIKGDTAEAWASSFLADILGGNARFARLNQSLREQSGFTYSVSLAEYLLPHTSFHIGVFSTSNATAKQALAKLRETFADLAKNGVSEEDLARMKSYNKGAFALRFTNNSSIAYELLGAMQRGEPKDYVEALPAKIDGITREDVNAVAAKLLKPENLIVVMVGRPQ